MDRQDVSEVRYALNVLRIRIEQEFRAGDTENPARWIEMLDLESSLRSLYHATKDWQGRWRKANKHPVTNWDLQNDEQRKVLDGVTFSRPMKCMSCGWSMFSDGDLARHYVIPDINFLDSWACWTKLAPEYADSRPEWPASQLAIRLEDLG